MPSLSSLSLSEPVKLLAVGDSGTGKTGALFDLAELGFKLRILDFDNGTITIFKEIARARKTPAEILDRIDIVTITEKKKPIAGGKYLIVKPTAWERGLRTLDNWPGDLGKPTSWGLDTILILDSMTLAGMASLEFVMMQNNKTGENPSQPNWGDAQRQLETMVQMLYTESVGCHVIVTSHVSTIANDSGVDTGYPMALGKALPPKIPRYFNIMVAFRSTGPSNGRERKMLSRAHPLVETKVPLLDFPQEIRLVDKPLAKLFAALGYPKAPEIEEKTQAPEPELTPPQSPITIPVATQPPKPSTPMRLR